MEIAIVLFLLVGAIIFFALEKVSVDIITGILLIILILSGIITTEEAFAGFGSDFIIILGSIFLITAAIQETGILDYLSTRLLKAQSSSSNRMLFYLMPITAAVSAFMNNTTTTALFITPVIGLSKRAGINASKLLMPLAFASIIGGTCTLIGTSTNIAVSGYMDKTGIVPLGMFEFLPIGLILLAVFAIYMITIGKRLLPDRKDKKLTEDYGMRQYLSEVVIMPESSLAGQLVFESDLSKMGFSVLAIVRNDIKSEPASTTRIEEGDTLLVRGNIDDLLKIKEITGVEIKADTIDFYVEKDQEIKLLEVLIPFKSNLIGSSIKEINFRRRFGLVVMAIHRSGQTLKEKIGDIELHVGDLLLVQGSEKKLNYLYGNTNMIILDEHKPIMRNKKKGFLTISFFILAIIIGTLGILPLSISFLSAAILIVLFKGITMEKAYNKVDWRLLVLIGGMSAFGTAMVNSGADEFLSHGIVQMLNPYGTVAVMAGFIVLTVILTQPLSNAAAALVILPVALQAATELGVDPRTFAITIMLSASISLIAPFEPACILVYGPGKYKFSDFLKVGTGLTIILMIILLLLIPVFWPL